MTDKIYKPLEVESIQGERMVFWVHSEDNPKKKYRVDLLSHGGLGQCSCDNWRARTWPRVRDGLLTPYEWPCGDKHIEAARKHVLLATLRHLASQETPPCTTSP